MEAGQVLQHSHTSVTSSPQLGCSFPSGIKAASAVLLGNTLLFRRRLMKADNCLRAPFRGTSEHPPPQIEMEPLKWHITHLFEPQGWSGVVLAQWGPVLKFG